MAEKILNTRIQLKYDTLAKWQSSVFNGDDPTKYLKSGEVAVVTLGTNKEEAPEAKGNQHPLLFKVGNGVSKFDDLPWASALAADVYDWAKLPYDSFLTKLGETFYTETEINTLIANYSTTEQMNTAISDAEGRAATDAKSKADKALEDAKAYTDALRNDVSIPEGGFASKTEFNALKEKVEDEDGALARANAAYELADAARTEDEVNTQIDTKLNAYRTSAAQDAIDETKADKSVVEAMYTNSQIDELIQGAKDYADTNDADTQYGIEYDSASKKIKLVSDTSKTEIDATDFIKDGMIESVTLSDDGLNLVITWNTDSDKGENNVTTIPLSGLVDVYTGVDGTTIKVDVSSDDKISAEVKTNSIKDGHIASDAAIAKSKLASDVQASLGKADTALQEHQDITGKADKVTGATAGNFAGLDANGNLTDSGKKATDFATAAQGEKADNAVQKGEDITIEKEIDGITPSTKLDYEGLYIDDDEGTTTRTSAGQIHLHVDGTGDAYYEANNIKFENADSGEQIELNLSTGLNFSNSGEQANYTKSGFNATNDGAGAVTLDVDGLSIQEQDEEGNLVTKFAVGTDGSVSGDDVTKANFNTWLGTPTEEDFGVLSVEANDTENKKSGIKIDNTNPQNLKVEVDDTLVWVFNCGGAE